MCTLIIVYKYKLLYIWSVTIHGNASRTNHSTVLCTTWLQLRSPLLYEVITVCFVKYSCINTFWVACVRCIKGPSNNSDLPAFCGVSREVSGQRMSTRVGEAGTSLKNQPHCSVTNFPSISAHICMYMVGWLYCTAPSARLGPMRELVVNRWSNDFSQTFAALYLDCGDRVSPLGFGVPTWLVAETGQMRSG